MKYGPTKFKHCEVFMKGNDTNRVKEIIAGNQEAIRRPQGLWKDEIYKSEKPGGLGKIELIMANGWKNNLITEPITRLLGGLMKNEGSFSGGVLFHAVGEGLVAWDTSLPDPTFTQTTLVNEHFRKAPDSITYKDSGGVPTGSITNRISIKTTFAFADGPGLNGKFMRNQGLFGGDATSTLDSGFLIDAINHIKIFKDATIQIVRTIDLIF